MVKLLDRLEIKIIENVPIFKLLPEFYLKSSENFKWVSRVIRFVIQSSVYVIKNKIFN